jgi:hypothetical protein
MLFLLRHCLYVDCVCVIPYSLLLICHSLYVCHAYMSFLICMPCLYVIPYLYAMLICHSLYVCHAYMSFLICMPCLYVIPYMYAMHARWVLRRTRQWSWMTYCRMCSLALECVLLLQNVVCYYRWVLRRTRQWSWMTRSEALLYSTVSHLSLSFSLSLSLILCQCVCAYVHVSMCQCVCVCVSLRESVCMSMCLCACVSDPKP